MYRLATVNGLLNMSTSIFCSDLYVSDFSTLICQSNLCSILGCFAGLRILAINNRHRILPFPGFSNRSSGLRRYSKSSTASTGAMRLQSSAAMLLTDRYRCILLAVRSAAAHSRHAMRSFNIYKYVNINMYAIHISWFICYIAW